MKKFFGIILLLITVSASSQKLEGSFQIVHAQYGEKPQSAEQLNKQRILKIFKDGYWIGAFFGDPERPFYGSGGGTYSTKDGKYSEKLLFYSWDSTAVGDTYNFNYSFNGNRYIQDGKMDSEKYPNYTIKEEFELIAANEPLQNSSLEGVWQMTSGNWGASKLGEGVYKNVRVIKIFAYPRFAFAYFDEKGKRFVGAGGGTYQFDGTTLNEKIEYWSWGTPKFPLSTFKVTLKSNQYTQVGWNDGLDETWKKLK